MPGELGGECSCGMGEFVLHLVCMPVPQCQVDNSNILKLIILTGDSFNQKWMDCSRLLVDCSFARDIVPPIHTIYFPRGSLHGRNKVDGTVCLHLQTNYRLSTVNRYIHHESWCFMVQCSTLACCLLDCWNRERSFHAPWSLWSFISMIKGNVDSINLLPVTWDVIS